jgi:hypothetical protein
MIKALLGLVIWRTAFQGTIDGFCRCAKFTFLHTCSSMNARLPVIECCGPCDGIILCDRFGLLNEPIVAIQIFRSSFIISFPCKLDVATAVVLLPVGTGIILTGTSFVLAGIFLLRFKAIRFMKNLGKKSSQLALGRNLRFGDTLDKVIIDRGGGRSEATSCHSLFELFFRDR